MLVNFTNHPYHCWSDIQKKVAEENYGQVIDISFTVVDPLYNEEEIMRMAEKWSKEIIDLLCIRNEQNILNVGLREKRETQYGGILEAKSEKWLRDF